MAGKSSVTAGAEERLALEEADQGRRLDRKQGYRTLLELATDVGTTEARKARGTTTVPHCPASVP